MKPVQFIITMGLLFMILYGIYTFEGYLGYPVIMVLLGLTFLIFVVYWIKNFI